MKYLYRYALLACTMVGAPLCAQSLTPEEQAQVEKHINYLDTIDPKEIETISETELLKITHQIHEVHESSDKVREAISKQTRNHPVKITIWLREIEFQIIDGTARLKFPG